MGDYAETLLDAISMVVDKKIESVKFDQTIKATIVDASNANTGKYIVSTGNAKFVAYSTEVEYKENDAVLVTIPQGNYDNQKIIIGKQVDDMDTPLIYKSPFQTIVNLSNNLISGTQEIAYYANDDRTISGRPWDINTLSFENSKVYQNPDNESNNVWWSSNNLYLQGYTRIGIQAQFSTWLNEYNTRLGNYGLAVEIVFKCVDLDENNLFSKFITLDSDNFFGDVYNFETYYTQEAVFDISEFLDFPIVQLKLFAYQRNNFTNSENQKIYEQEDLPDDDNFSNIGPNIFIKDPYLCLGISAGEFSSDMATIMTEHPLTYYKGNIMDYQPDEENSPSERSQYNLKHITLRWVHRDTQNDIIKTIEPNEFPKGYEVRWYRFKLGAKSPDQFAGAHWERFYSTRTIPTAEGEWLLPHYLATNVIENGENYFLQNSEEEFYPLENLNEILEQDINNNYIYNEEHQGFKKIKENPEDEDEYISVYIETEDDNTNALEIDFQPNVNLQTEKIKAIIVKQEKDNILRRIAVSNILEFTNNDEIRSKATVIDENTLAIRYEDEERGNYLIYGRAGSVNKGEDKEIRVLTAVFEPNQNNVYEKADLTECTSIKWIFPSQDEGTMIIPATSADVSAEPVTATDEKDKTEFEGVYQVGYFIKKNLNRNANANTVQLIVVKDGQEYTAQIQMIFGTAGTSGSDYTLLINWEDGKNAFNASPGLDNPLVGQIYLMDSSGQPMDIPENSHIEASWYAVAYPEMQPTPAVETDEKYYPIARNGVVVAPTGLQVTGSDYWLTRNAGDTLYLYDIDQGDFIEYTGSNYDQILYKKVSGKRKIEFVPVEQTIGPPTDLDNDENVVTDNNNINRGKIMNDNRGIRTYYYKSPQRLFVKIKDMYVIDPWDQYQETEIYYEPIYSQEVVYLNNCPLQYSTIIENGINKVVIQKADNNATVSPNQLYILQITLTHFGDYNLVAYFPIPIKNGEIVDNSIIDDNGNIQKTYVVDYIDGPTDVRYATTGETDFEKNPYDITVREFDNENEIFVRKRKTEGSLEGYWRLLYYLGENDTAAKANLQQNFLPELLEVLDSNGIPQVHKSYYKQYSGLTRNQYAFDNPKLNPTGVYFKDAPLYGVQFVRSDDTVLWTQPVLVYQDNYPSTTLNKWNGKDIQMNEDDGTIVANGMAAGKKESDNTFTGVVLGDWSRTDTDAFITQQTGVYGFNHGAMSYALKDDGTAFFGKDGKGRIYLNGNQAQIYSAHWVKDAADRNGMLIDIDDGKIQMISAETTQPLGTRASLLMASSGNPYFQIKNKEDKTLIYIGQSRYYLQSGDFEQRPGQIPPGYGVKFDLENGKITGYSFDIEAYYNSNNIDNNDDDVRIETPVASYGYSSNNAAATDSGISYNYSGLTYRTVTTTSYSDSDLNSLQKYIKIKSSAKYNPLRIGSNFKVSWEGFVSAQGGTFNNLKASGANITYLKASDIETGSLYVSGTSTFNNLTVQGLLKGGLIKGSEIYAKKFHVTTDVNGTADYGWIGYVESGLPNSTGSGIGITAGTADTNTHRIIVTQTNVGMSGGTGNYVTCNSSSNTTQIGGSTITIGRSSGESGGTTSTINIGAPSTSPTINLNGTVSISGSGGTVNLKGTEIDTYIKNLINAAYIKGIVDATYIKGIVDTAYVQGIISYSYLTGKLNNTYAAYSHSHSGYALVGHTHSEYASSGWRQVEDNDGNYIGWVYV